MLKLIVTSLLSLKSSFYIIQYTVDTNQPSMPMVPQVCKAACNSSDEVTVPLLLQNSPAKEPLSVQACAHTPRETTVDEQKHPVYSQLMHNAKWELCLTDDIELRGYQKELADPGLNGSNYILVAPTGTGKTLIAGYIIVHHLKMKEGKQRGKVAFVTPTRQLTYQQKNQLQHYIPGLRAVDITGASGQPMHPLIQSNLVDVVVCTAGKLRKELKTKNVQITDFSLIIADECHHAGRLSNYVDIMEFYIRLKHSTVGHPPLPQVVGMTASPGAGRGKANLDKAVEHQVSLCANLDAVAGIVTVRINIDELESIRNDPKPYLEVGDERSPNDLFILNVASAMQSLEASLGEVPCVTRGSSKYVSWLQNEKEAAENRVENESQRISVCDLLIVYSQSLMTYRDFQYDDAVAVLKEVTNFPNPSPFEETLNTVYSKLMKVVAEIPKIPNPLLVHMESILLEQFSKSPDSKGIFFVQNIEHTTYVTNWIKSSSSLLRVIRVAPICGTKGMEKSEQIRVLEGFRNGTYNLLASTSVLEEGLDIPQCNFVIRYQNVTNEIAQVQAKGRARAEDSRIYTVVSSNSRKDYWYLVQEEKQRLVGIAIDALQHLPLEQHIQKKQQMLIEELDRKAQQLNMLRSKWPQAENVEILCKKCKIIACNGSDVFAYSINGSDTHYVVPKRAFSDGYKKENHDTPEKFEDFVKPYRIFCRSENCRNKWGIIGLWRETGHQFPLLKCEQFLFKYKSDSRKFRNWKDIWFEVQCIHDFPEYEEDIYHVDP